ncbi:MULTISPECIES: 6,7-dimethyl-8-ribityllumazine synthase [Myroides]|jgi:6,7-dimethyl-8-ribityllumazine synthase|uniref:6,7-dimethyl-8-ribityllumazine synthase n=1 Tax=Myroides odoratus TaxID=256 RepID=A0A378RUB2_MYROD|nr:6,7-dimethyl-8-ribityllumazine synthase [Myroides odoratus]EHQ43338.1 6,7-dimethyl-8-ribityllumazine synthase [Myroides odoratus DSM 2801]EKB06725.1 6,7-dimethyl-8-ribityllumazine synthase [Myroides odoratus CIP 103059]MDR0224693.1 6,7-dimethyl-8-ribityllumazine synthase [Myroides odoratus]QQU00681.1 6,7-dimethyl-8-ribityllumazine synthase [Myroides odoratus]QQU02726.1 6,7-dimethyl-8-ribityllumazine synthase [Myroides odoratus]
MATANKNLSAYDKTTLPSATNMKVGIVVSNWNDTITEGLFDGAKRTLLDCGLQEEGLIRWDVPGSFELVFGAKRMIERFEDLDAVIVIGCVIKGETMHFEFVCEGVTHGIKDLNLIADIPVIFCVLTDNTIEQSLARSGGDMGNKGVEAAVTALKMIALNNL